MSDKITIGEARKRALETMNQLENRRAESSLAPAQCSAERPTMLELQSQAAVARRRFYAGDWGQRQTIDDLEKQMAALTAQPNVKLCDGRE